MTEGTAHEGLPTTIGSIHILQKGLKIEMTVSKDGDHTYFEQITKVSVEVACSLREA